MKKIAVILLISVYSLATVGFSLKNFYCCGDLRSVNFSLTGASNQYNKSNDKSDCCKTTYQFFKINQNHIAADQIHSPADDFSFIQSGLLLLEATSIPLSQKLDDIKSIHAPPFFNKIPIYLSNRVIRI